MNASQAATPFRKILIANRGEVALRVIRSARALGYRTVAVYSTADAGGRHVREADQAVCIGEPLPAQSYLCIPALIDAAHRCGADAVHPGYGFLAENPEFAQACKDAGLVFIGPSAQVMAGMGDKAGAKMAMQRAGVPCVPGYQGDDQDAQRLAEEAEQIGFPVMIKARAGGGGRGMRRVDAAWAFPALLRSAQAEAQAAFGNADVILERAILAPRHIEIQVFADGHGNAVHLGERDCSVQRRHQKLIEEAPSPVVSDALRARMGAIAVQAVQAVGYEGAGTLEFLLDAAGDFYFMEMNTRLQVEHPVTEAITGLDLVEWQLRIAAGERLPLAQDEIRFSGHAIEVRLCAEDAGKGFLPQSGTVALWRPPSGVRVEDALFSGAEVPPFYDSMIAKVIAHGATREEARRRLIAALEDTVALGVTTNQRFLRQCLAHATFAAGGATTAFVDAHLDELLAEPPHAQARAAALAAVLLQETAGAGRRHLPLRLPMSRRLSVDGEQATRVTLAVDGAPRYALQVGECAFVVEAQSVADDHAYLVCDRIFERIDFHRDGNMLLLHHRGRASRIDDLTFAPPERMAHGGGDGTLRAAMNGRIVAVLAEPGASVTVGQPLLTLEAMKMEHVHAAPLSGTLMAVHAAVGEQVAAGRVLAEIAAGPAAPA